MPRKNTIKEYAPHSYYHVYTRGNNKQKIFLSTDDFTYFLMLLDRYIGKKEVKTKDGYKYPRYHLDICIETYCLMSNHFHLLIYVGDDSDSLTRFMSSLKTSYSMYFNKKHKRVGTVFESRYKAVRVTDEQYLAHIHRYIHLNPKEWKTYKYSSLNYFFSDTKPSWLDTSLVESSFATKDEYLSYIADYESTDREMHKLQYMLADQ